MDNLIFVSVGGRIMRQMPVGSFAGSLGDAPEGGYLCISDYSGNTFPSISSFHYPVLTAKQTQENDNAVESSARLLGFSSLRGGILAAGFNGANINGLSTIVSSVETRAIAPAPQMQPAFFFIGSANPLCQYAENADTIIFTPYDYASNYVYLIACYKTGASAAANNHYYVANFQDTSIVFTAAKNSGSYWFTAGADASGSFVRRCPNTVNPGIASNWIRFNAPADVTFYTFDFADGVILAGGNDPESSNAAIYKSTDNGETWEMIFAETISDTSGSYIWSIRHNGGNYVAADSAGNVLASNGVNNWSVTGTLTGGNGISGVIPDNILCSGGIADTVFFAVILVNGDYAFSMDNGLTWTTVNSAIPGLTSVAFLPGEEAFYFGSNSNGLYRSTNPANGAVSIPLEFTTPLINGAVSGGGSFAGLYSKHD